MNDSWTVPGPERTPSNPGYLNLSDWKRLVGNVKLVGKQLSAGLPGTYSFHLASQLESMLFYTAASIPSASDWNLLLSSIEGFVGIYNIHKFSIQNLTFSPGVRNSPTYLTVNSMEQRMNDIRNLLLDQWLYCGNSYCGEVIL